MDPKQIQETSRQLQKAQEGNDPPSTLITLLAPLQKWSATEDLLRQSKIGVVVSKFRTNKDPKVASLAGTLINKWKADVSAGKKKLSPATNGRSSGTSSPAPPSSVKKESVTSAPKKTTVAPEKRNAKEDGVDTAITGNSTRDGCVQLIYNGLAFMSSEAPDEILSVSRDVEAAAFELYNSNTSADYKLKMRSLHLNLKMKQNIALRRNVFSREIPPEKFVRMTSEELKSREKRESDAALEKENMNKAMTAQEEKAISTTYVYFSQLFYDGTEKGQANVAQDGTLACTQRCARTLETSYSTHLLLAGMVGRSMRSSLRSVHLHLQQPLNQELPANIFDDIV